MNSPTLQPPQAALSPALDALELDEGMWTLENLPLDALRTHYRFAPSPRFIETLRGASLRFNDGGSGSFVSPDGLILTNHHVALGQLHKVSGAKRDYVKDGFYARAPSRELPCPDLEINQLVSAENVTERVLSAVPPGADDKTKNERRKGAMAAIEKESLEKTGLRSDVVELYQGGEYWLHRSKKYTDIRLVMAPELDAAFFGGDEDNFTYPRFALDFAFFRAYEDGKPVRPKRYFPFRPEGAREGELCFVLGHPGSTERLLTSAQLRFQKDLALPTRLRTLKAYREALIRYAGRGAEQARRAREFRFGVENSLKVLSGELEGLLEGNLLARKEAQEAALRERAAADPSLADCAAAWPRIEEARREFASGYATYAFRRLGGYRLPWLSETLTRYGVELEKPNEKRYEEFRDSALESLRFRLLSPAPLHPDLEEAMLAQGLALSLRELGAEDVFIRQALGGLSPERAAHEAVAKTRLGDPAFRKALLEGGRAAVEASPDPMLRLSRRVDACCRERRAFYEDRIQSVERLESVRIAKARFALLGRSVYPDATFTLRLSYGTPLGYEAGKTRVPYKTTFGGLYDRADSFDQKPPFALPRRLAAARARARHPTPLNFVSTHDIIGGNSGSPVVDARGRLVGLIFDGNIQSLLARYAYSRETGRAVSVHAGAILEALTRVYGMRGLARELQG